MIDADGELPRAGFDFELDLAADVLVIGGGPAGAWAALTAKAAGTRRVILVGSYSR